LGHVTHLACGPFGLARIGTGTQDLRLLMQTAHRWRYSHEPSSRLSLLCARLSVTVPASECHRPCLASNNLCLY